MRSRGCLSTKNLVKRYRLGATILLLYGGNGGGGRWRRLLRRDRRSIDDDDDESWEKMDLSVHLGPIMLLPVTGYNGGKGGEGMEENREVYGSTEYGDDSNHLILPKGGGGMRSRECLSLRWSSPENGCHVGCRVPTIGPLPARNDPDRELACFL